MSRRVLEYIFAVQLKAQLNAACKVVNNIFLGVQVVIGGPDGKELDALRSSQVLDQIETLAPVWKFLKIDLHSDSCLDNSERFRFVICFYAKDLPHGPRHESDQFG